MLIRFSVKNFRSLYERQDLFFSAEKFTALHGSLIRAGKFPGGVLPVIAIYGANGSGKSNVLRAMHYMYRAISDSHNRWAPEGNLPFDPHFFHPDEPSEFECEFLLGREVYRFGFSLDKSRFLTEHLYAGRTLVFRRSGNRYRLGSGLQHVNSIKKSTRANSLFLSAGAQNNHLLFKKIYRWFASWDTITDDRTYEEALTGFSSSHERTRKFLAKAISMIVPDVEDIEPCKDRALRLPEGLDESEEALLKDHHKFRQLKFIHRSKDGKASARVDLADESRGTQSYLTLANNIILTLGNGSVLLLDEADQSLHPSLLRSLVMLFQDKSTNPRGAQLVCNTHDTNLLSPEVLRPDQIWFVERCENLETHLYSLADFRGIRSDSKSQRAYLEGRFGALPFLENQAKIFSEYLDFKGETPADAIKEA